jgi:hypothetical protein
MYNKIVEKEKMKLKFTSFLSERPTLNAKRAKIFAEFAMIVGNKDILTSESELLSYKAPGLSKGVPLKQLKKFRKYSR